MNVHKRLVAVLPALALYQLTLAGCDGTALDPSQNQQESPAAHDPFAEDTLDNSQIRKLFETSPASVSPVSDSSATEWIFRTTSTTTALPIYSGTTVNLFNSYNNNYVKYGSRTYGINLVWSSTMPQNISFQRAGGAGALRYGDVIAINVSGGGYLKYGSRTWGINLVWSSTPIYEWEVAGGPIGQTVYTNQRVRLINRTERNGMVYCQRPTGINLAWQDNCTEALGYRILIDYLCSINPIC